MFTFVLRAAYSLTKETIGQITGQKLIIPIIYDGLAILPKDHYSPWHYIVGLAIFLLSVIPTSLFCGVFFSYFFRERTALWSIIPSGGLIAFFLTSLRHHSYFWTVYCEYALLVSSFFLFCILASKCYQELTARTSTNSTRNMKLIISRVAPTMVIATVVFAWLHLYYPLLGTVVTGKGYEGIILKKEFVANPHDWWSIQDNDIRVLEAHLERYINSHQHTLTPRLVYELTSYRRWYNAKLSKTGERQIHVFLMHQSRVSRSTWLHVYFGVLGGGDTYWDLTYIVKDGSFENVRCNADA